LAPADDIKDRLMTRGSGIVASLVLIAAIFLFTHLPDAVVEQILPVLGLGEEVDNILHAVVYAALALILVSTISGRCRGWSPLIALVLVMVIGSVDELTQPSFGRSRRLGDWASNVGGAGIALVCWHRFHRSPPPSRVRPG
jgi:hypothetical protein